MARKIIKKAAPAAKESMEPMMRLNGIEGMQQPRPEKDHEAEDAANHLMRAEEIKQNPDLMNRVQKHIKKKKSAIKNIQDLKRAYAEKTKPDAEDQMDGGIDEDQEQS